MQLLASCREKLRLHVNQWSYTNWKLISLEVEFVVLTSPFAFIVQLFFIHVWLISPTPYIIRSHVEVSCIQVWKIYINFGILILHIRTNPADWKHGLKEVRRLQICPVLNLHLWYTWFYEVTLITFQLETKWNACDYNRLHRGVTFVRKY